MEPSQQEERGWNRGGKDREGETPTQVGPHTTVPSFVGHRMGMSCSTDTGYTALYTSWRCPAACRTSAWPVQLYGSRRLRATRIDVGIQPPRRAIDQRVAMIGDIGRDQWTVACEVSTGRWPMLSAGR